MKQGQATHSSVGSTKVEPKAHVVNVEAVADMGLQQSKVGRAQSAPLYQGRGLTAPMASETVHKKGSQGNY